MISWRAIVFAVLVTTCAGCVLQPKKELLCPGSAMVYDRPRVIQFYVATDVLHVTTAAVAECPNLPLDVRFDALGEQEMGDLSAALTEGPRDPDSGLYVRRVSARARLLRPDAGPPVVSLEKVLKIDREQPPSDLRAALLMQK